MSKIHFIGIGGIGMSALAALCLKNGETVTGSDTRMNRQTKKLRLEGAIIRTGHASGNISPDTDRVVKSSCIFDDNPEIVRAKELDIPIIPRSDFLKIFLERADISIGVTGTHGKTTTSALVAHILEDCGLDPTVLVGGEMERFGGNVKKGSRDLIVSEVDESDGFFRRITVRYAIVTNVEREHIDNYGSMENLTAAYREFMGNIPPDGAIVMNADDPLLKEIPAGLKVEKIKFGFSSGADYTCEDLKSAMSIEFELIKHGRKAGKVKSSLLGRHNAMNILAAMALCLELGLSFEKVAAAVSGFKSVARRFELIGEIGGVRVIEDYAHHPTEIRAVIRAAKDWSAGRIITVFQPHRYSRTKDLEGEFLGCFNGTDVLVLTDVYSADERASEVSNSNAIYENIDKSKFERLELLQKEDIPAALSPLIREKDTVLILGAGDIIQISAPLVAAIKEHMGYAVA